VITVTDYRTLASQLSELMKASEDPVTNAANAAALIFWSMDGLNWAGFYFKRGDRLVLGPFQGRPACVSIPVGRGVCGTAAKENRTVIVPDVHAFPGHIACDSASRSEIVIPLRKNGEVFGVLDIDSPLIARFDESDGVGLAELARIMEEVL